MFSSRISLAKGTLAVYDVLGQIIFTSKITNRKTEINIRTYPKGVYFIQIQTEKGIMRKKFVTEGK